MCRFRFQNKRLARPIEEEEEEDEEPELVPEPEVMPVPIFRAEERKVSGERRRRMTQADRSNSSLINANMHEGSNVR